MKGKEVPVAFLAGAVSAAIATVMAYRWKIKTSETELMIHLPAWLVKLYQDQKDKVFESIQEMSSFAVDISARNVSEGTGGPFGCAIFQKDKKTGQTKLFAVGCNRVVPLTNSTLHAEIVAIQFAQKKLKLFSMKSDEAYEYILCTSCEPCCMCLGGVMWSGVAQLVCAAAKDDAEKIGFNEGPVFPESYKQLEDVGIRVTREVQRAEGAAVLEKYGATGVIYNG